MIRLRFALLASCVAVLAACKGRELPKAPHAEAQAAEQRQTSAAAASPKPATHFTDAANAAAAKQLPFADRQDFEDARRGYIASLPRVEITGDDGQPVFTLQGYEFLQQEQSPPTVHPSLWRIAQLNMNNGLFKVTEGIYQIRGFDLSNMTIVEGNTGLILIDPLISPEAAKAGLDLYLQHRPRKPVRAVIYTHSHVDHYGGVRGVVSEADARANRVQILAPEGFLEAAVSENVYAGNAMARRSLYMYGSLLPRGEKGQVDAGLGKTTSLSPPSLLVPTTFIKRTGERRTIDGVQIIFQMAQDTEAPAEMLFYFPQLRALCAAEDATHNLHNLYTLRGAQVRDAKAWWKTLNRTLELFGDRTDVLFASHHWPTFGNAAAVAILKDQRDMYKFIHDQSLRLMNQGYTMVELAEKLALPPALATKWYNRGYYGSVNHDAKAVYQRYLGWYDSHPATLHMLPREQSAKKYLEFMGGEGAVMKKARAAFDQGDYRWVAEVLTHVVFADPSNAAARYLQADALEQLGYQTENATWRNEYLMGAYELRNGVPKADLQPASLDTVRAMSSDMLLDFMGIRVDADKVAQQPPATFEFTFLDRNERWAVTLEHGVLIYSSQPPKQPADATIQWPRASLEGILFGKTTLDQEVDQSRAKVTGDRAKVEMLLASLVSFEPTFAIVTPAKPSQTQAPSP